MFYFIVCIGLLTQMSIKHLIDIKYSPAGWGTHGCHAADCHTQRNPNYHLNIYRSQPLDFDLRVTSIQCEGSIAVLVPPPTDAEGYIL